MLTIHHLGKSQSERIVWLCEELGIDYELKRYQRDPVTFLAPPDYKALHPIGSAPVITDAGAMPAPKAATWSSPNWAPSSSTSSPNTAMAASP